MMNYAKVSGFSDEIAPEIDVQFEVLGKLGISYFEPRGVDGVNISDITDENRAELKKKMEKCNIQVSSIGSPIGKIKITDDFEPHFEKFKKVVETAKFLGTKYIRMFSFYHDGDVWTKEERDEVLKRLKMMLDYAKSENVILLHENEKDIYGDNAERCLDLMKELACDNFRAVFDPANFVQCGQDTLEAYEMLKPYIEYMHIKDADENGDVVPAGYGIGNVEAVLKALFDNGFNGFVSLEPHLGSFQGLAALETDDKMEKLPEGGEGTFTLAANSLNKILKNIL